MIDIKKNLRTLIPYKVNTKPYDVKLDANEGSNYLLNAKLNLDNFVPQLYPDSDAVLLRENMASYYGCKKSNIMVGNGSSELILNVINSFCDKEDKVITFEPSFSMYPIYCKLADVKYSSIKSQDNYSFKIENILNKYDEEKPKILIICNPNNPTGSYIEKKDIIKILDYINDTVVILDEAYIEFGGESSVDLINNYENLIVMRTLSKAFGLAGLRVGGLISNERMVDNLWKVKLPYNINSASQYIANQAFENLNIIEDHIDHVKMERNRMKQMLEKEEMKPYNSMTNFIMFETSIENLDKKLEKKGVLIRNFSKDIENHYRVSIGKKEDNDLLINRIKEVKYEEGKRS